MLSLFQVFVQRFQILISDAIFVKIATTTSLRTLFERLNLRIGNEHASPVTTHLHDTSICYESVTPNVRSNSRQSQTVTYYILEQ